MPADDGTQVFQVFTASRGLADDKCGARSGAAPSLSLGELVYGDDWPAWMRDLGPATYVRDPDAVKRMIATAARELTFARRQLANYTRDGDLQMVRYFRRQVERWALNLRNSETRLRLLTMTGRELVATLRAMPTATLEQVLGAA